jgi:hypothetical protein
VESSQKPEGEIHPEVHPHEKPGRTTTVVSLKERLEALAGYLETEHWSNPTENGAPGHIPLDNICEHSSYDEQRMPFSAEEIETALSLTKKGKEPGPDLARMELFKWMSEQSKGLLLAAINLWWEALEELYMQELPLCIRKATLTKLQITGRPHFLVAFTNHT